jgi:integrase
MKEDIELLKEKFLIANNNYYRNDVENFINYIETQETGASFYSKFTLQGMSTKGILESLKHYVNIEQFQKKETARKYISAIGQLFEYILSHTDIENTDLKNQLGAPSNRKDSYLGQCTDYINNCEELLEKESLSMLTEEQAKQLLDWCNNEIDNSLDLNTEQNERIGFKRLVAAICIKLMLFLGITYRVARVLRFSDLDVENNTIMINGYITRLPLILSKQFRKYKTILGEKGFDTQDGFLFITLDGTQWGEKTSSSSIPTFLKSQLGQTNITSIIKYGIKQLILNGMSDNVIIKLTGISREILNDCLEPSDTDIFAYINAKIINTPIYKYL